MRMPDPTAPECDCRVLERLSKEPKVPVVYDPELNEYLIQTADGLNKVKMHHCFFCGGWLPKSRRDELFMHITDEERTRLWAVLKDIRTLPDLLTALGPPDRDDPMGIAEGRRADDGGDRTTYYRRLTYCGLSPTAEVHAVLHLDDRVQYSFWPKPADKVKS